MRHMDEFGAIRTVFTRGAAVPQPNNALYNGQLARFNEFPSVPRIDANSDTIATRAQSQPVWTFTLGDGSETRTGTAGVYTNPKDVPTTGASMLGDVAGFEYFKVPIADVPLGDGLRPVPGFARRHRAQHDRVQGQFRRAWRRQDRCLLSGHRGQSRRGADRSRREFVHADSRLPCQVRPHDPRSARLRRPARRARPWCCAGYDDEGQHPSAGGIYRAQLGSKPITLQKVVGVGDLVPGEVNQRFKTFGEAISLSSNGRSVLFWGTWGTETRKVTLTCPPRVTWPSDRTALQVTGNGLEVEVPVNQGFFVRDMQLGTTVLVARTGGQFLDFMYWNFSGRAPGVGGGEEGRDDIEEPARWRTATFGAVSGSGVPTVAAFKARTVAGKDGIYARPTWPSKLGEITTLLETGDCRGRRWIRRRRSVPRSRRSASSVMVSAASGSR